MSLNYVLLTGAGFSKNWGGWIANDLWSVILSHPLTQKNDKLKDSLWSNKELGFENIFDDKALDAKDKADYQQVVIDSFVEMHGVLKSPKFTPDKLSHSFSIPNTFSDEIMNNFDGFFSLNQDLFFEYLSIKDWAYPYINNANEIYDIFQNKKEEIGELKNNLGKMTFTVGTNLTDKTKSKPYYKVHGSLNFKSDNGSNLIIMGRLKENQINDYELLKKYREDFPRILMNAKKLMIVGYSFKDDYINQIIFDSVMKNNLKIWIIDKSELESLIYNAAQAKFFENNKEFFNEESYKETKRAQFRKKTELEKGELFRKIYDELKGYFKQSLICISTNNLSIFNTNDLEVSRINRYFFDK